MSGKSRHNRAKHISKSKKKQPSQAVSRPKPEMVVKPPDAFAPASPPRRPPAPEPVAVLHHPHITRELRRIGVLAGIMLAVLVILAVVIP